MSSHERARLEEVLREVRMIAKLDITKDERFPDRTMGYAHALGRANGMAFNAQVIIESLLGVKTDA